MRFFLAIILLLFFASLSAQNERKADKLYELFEFEAAIHSYLLVLEEQPDNMDAMAKMADCHRMLNNMDDAAAWYLKVVRQKGADPIHFFRYGLVLKSLSKYKEASTWFLNYAETNPTVGRHFAESCRVASALIEQASPFELRNEFINSVFSDFGPAFYQGRVVSSSARTDIPLSAKRDRFKWQQGIENQLFISDVLPNEFLEKPSFYHTELAHNKNEGPVAFSADGNWVAFTKNNFKSGVRHIQGSGMQLSIYIASVDSRGNWGEAKPFPYNGNDFSTGFPFLSADGNTLYFASDRPDSYGGFDLFYSKKSGNSWSEPVNLGSMVNTPGNEITPFLTNNQLYFASDWHYGLGAMDIFKASEQFDAWGDVKNMGPGINSPFDDFGLIMTAKSNEGYFVSNRPGGKGKEDIYRFLQKMDVYSLVVQDASSQSALADVSFDLSSCGQAVYQSDNKGQVTLNIAAGDDCKVMIRKTGYSDYSLVLNHDVKPNANPFLVSLIKKGERFVGKVLHAETNAPVQDVKIFATNQTTGAKLELVSNSEGEYVLPITTQNSYLIRFSKPGFLDINKQVTIDKKNYSSFLEATYLQPAYRKEKTTPVEPVKTDKPATSALKEDKWSPQSPKEGYSIQVGAFFQTGNEADLTGFADLKPLGKLYSVREGNSVKVRLGIFPNRMEAEGVRKQLEEKGYQQTFIIQEVLDNNLLPYWLGEDSPIDSSPTSQNGGYKIQLGAYSDTANFDGSKIKTLGVIEEKIKGKLTIMLLSGFNSIEEAKAAFSQVHDAGFFQAFLVVEQDGQLKRVQE